MGRFPDLSSGKWWQSPDLQSVTSDWTVLQTYATNKISLFALKFSDVLGNSGKCLGLLCSGISHSLAIAGILVDGSVVTASCECAGCGNCRDFHMSNW